MDPNPSSLEVRFAALERDVRAALNRIATLETYYAALPNKGGATDGAGGSQSA